MRKVTVVKLDSRLVALYRKACKVLGMPMNHTMERVLRDGLASVEQAAKRFK